MPFWIFFLLCSDYNQCGKAINLAMVKVSANSQFDDCLLLSSFVDSPQVSLRLGRTLDADNIRTGHDVYFECDVKANPSPLRLEWLHNVNT